LKCKDGDAREALMTSVTPNCILLPYDAEREGVLILREFKTQDRANPKLYSRRLGLELSDEIRASLQQHPRDYLFCEAFVSKPYTHGGFQQYASRTLKALFGRPCTLTLLRLSYISHMLAYGQLSIKDREELARDMCHSVNTQAQYQFIHLHWFWGHRLKECELTNKRGLSHRQKGSESLTEGVWGKRVWVINKSAWPESLTKSVWVTDNAFKWSQFIRKAVLGNNINGEKQDDAALQTIQDSQIGTVTQFDRSTAGQMS